jgi:adenylate cyclase class 2
MLEVEMKFADADHDAVKRRLQKWGARKEGQRQEIDHYFNAPDRDFARTDEALRIRLIGGGSNCVTYKGPKCDAETKTRTEFEIELNRGKRAAEEFMQLLVHLGYRPVEVVRKRRRYYQLRRGRFTLDVCLDQVDGLGEFVELEIRAREDQLDAARTVVLDTAKELGLSRSERRSYLELLLEAHHKKPSARKESP